MERESVLGICYHLWCEYIQWEFPLPHRYLTLNYEFTTRKNLNLLTAQVCLLNRTLPIHSTAFPSTEFPLMSFSKLLSLPTDSSLINFHSIHVLIQKFIDNSSMKLIYVIWKITSLWALKTRKNLFRTVDALLKIPLSLKKSHIKHRGISFVWCWRFIKAENIDDSEEIIIAACACKSMM